MDAFLSGPAPLPPPHGRVIEDESPAEEDSVIEAETDLPAGIEVTKKPVEIPKDAGQLP